jgi:hypothetical protein
MRHDRRPVVGDDEDLQTVREFELGDALGGAGIVYGKSKRHGREAHSAQDEACLEIGRAKQLIEHRHNHVCE